MRREGRLGTPDTRGHGRGGGRRVRGARRRVRADHVRREAGAGRARIVEAWLESTVEPWRPRAEVAYDLSSPEATDVPTGDDRAWAESEIGRELTDDEWHELIGACRAYAAKVEAVS